MKFYLPPKQKNRQGEMRKVGFELEFAGIELDEAASAVVATYGGRHVKESRLLHKVVDTQFGDFTLEMDAAVLRDKAYEKYLEKIGIDISGLLDRESLDDFIEKVASVVVPYEIAAPPIALNELEAIDKLRQALQQLKAQGTRASVLYAFGLHINPEAPAVDIQTLLNYFRAFLLLYHWIRKESDIDFSRRLTPFIDEFPEEYTQKVLNPDYKPEMEQFCADYIADNPTRNRPLDMLPVFAYLDEDLVKGLEDELVKPRPAFHYRLPNCLIDDPAWSIATEWNYWVEVEKLAGEGEKIQRYSRDYLALMDSSLINFKDKWYKQVNKWIN